MAEPPPNWWNFVGPVLTFPCLFLRVQCALEYCLQFSLMDSQCMSFFEELEKKVPVQSLACVFS